MKLQHLIQQVFYEPSLITGDGHAAIRQLLEHRLAEGEAFEIREPGQGICGAKVEVEEMEIIDGIAHIPIGGAIGQKLKPFQRGEGAVDVLEVTEELDLAEADDEVRGALIDMDSPGGMFSGTPELATRIEAFDKPIYCFSRGTIASGAYWLAAACDGIFTTRSSMVGSIGVVLPVLDDSAAMAAKGLRVILVKAGKFKGTGFSGQSISESQQEYLQRRVNEMYQMFTSFVRDMRGADVSEETMQGQMFLAAEAVDRGLIDGIVKDKDEVLELFD